MKQDGCCIAAALRLPLNILVVCFVVDTTFCSSVTQGAGHGIELGRVQEHLDKALRRVG